MKEFVKVQDITKTYKMGEVEIHAVDHISFSIEQGELVVIVDQVVQVRQLCLIFSAEWIQQQVGSCM